MKQRHTRRVRRDEKAARWRKALRETPLWENGAPSPLLAELDALLRAFIGPSPVDAEAA